MGVPSLVEKRKESKVKIRLKSEERSIKVEWGYEFLKE